MATALTQATNDKQQVVPMLDQLQALPQDLGRVKRLLADTGYASEDNVNACAQAKIQPLIALGREAHHDSPFDRFAEPAPLPGKPTPMAAMRHRLQTDVGAAVCVAQMHGGAGVRIDQARHEIPAIPVARTGERTRRMEFGVPGVEHEANECPRRVKRG